MSACPSRSHPSYSPLPLSASFALPFPSRDDGSLSAPRCAPHASMLVGVAAKIFPAHCEAARWSSSNRLLSRSLELEAET